MQAFDIEFVWYWPGWGVAGVIFVYFLLCATLIRLGRVSLLLLLTLVLLCGLVAYVNVMAPYFGANSGWVKTILTMFAAYAAPLVVVAAPMLALRRAKARFGFVVSAGLLATIAAVFGFFAVAHHLVCSVARIDCL